MRASVAWAVSCAAAVALVFVPGPGVQADEATSPDALWTRLPAPLRAPGTGTPEFPHPANAARLGVDVGRLLTVLDAASPEGDASPEDRPVLWAPTPEGSFVRFGIEQVTAMEPGLAEAYPEIRTVGGTGLDEEDWSLRGTWTPHGLNLQVLRPEGPFYVTPLVPGDPSAHACYAGAADAGGFGLCDTEDFADTNQYVRAPGGSQAVVSGEDGLRTYRIAVAATFEYVTAWTNEAGAIAQIVATVNAVNQIFERDVAVRYVVIANEAAIVYETNAIDPFTRPFSSPLSNNEAQTAITAAIGAANFDIGHLIDDTGAGTGSWSGNAGAIGSICNDTTDGAGNVFAPPVPVSGSRKARGWTQSDDTTASPQFVHALCHEMGHQAGGTHTMNGTACGGQRSQPSAFEPGGGTTIMSYIFGCGADGLPGVAYNPDGFYYHGTTIAAIDAYVDGGGGDACDGSVAVMNTPPTVNGGSDFTIPKQTPFVLTATGNDADGDTLSYCWEQTDPGAVGGPAAVGAADDGVIPLFRSFPPVAGGARTFPRLTDLLAGNLFPGTLGEQLPALARAMDFQVTVRDRAGGAGGVGSDTVVLTVDAVSGPFAVTAPNGGESWPEGTSQTVTWDVAGTTAPPVSTASVDILLSVDGGLTYPHVLAAATPNDGSQSVTLPSCVISTTARVRVAAVGNVYFDVSDADFSLVDVTPPTVTCSVGRRVIIPASNGLLDVALTFSAVDACDPAPTLQSVTVSSDEGPGVAYTPDATWNGTTLRLRAERDIAQNGRLYLIKVQFVDGSGQVGFGLCTAVVPLQPTVSSITSATSQAAAAQAASQGAGGAIPPGFVSVLP